MNASLNRGFVMSFLACLAANVSAAIVEVSPGDDLRGAIAALGPGDELVLTAGQYDFDSRFNITAVGQPGSPIVIRARDGDDVLISMNTAAHNILEVQDSQYLELRELRFTGGSHGIRLINSDYITIENCEVFETGDVAISANSGGTFEGLLIRGNHIHHTNGTGEGMYLGCNNDGCRVQNSIIEWNYIHHTNRPSVEQGDGIEIKEGSSGNIVRHNVIHDTHYPGILTYSTVGNGPPNIIEGNLIWNTDDYAIQSAADSIIRNNIVLGSSIALQPHQAGSPGNQEVVHNTVIVTGSGIDVRNATGPVVVANNAIYSQYSYAIRLISSSTNLVTVEGNVGSGGLLGGNGGFTDGQGIGPDFVAADYEGAPPIDVFPAVASALIVAGSPAWVTEFDFNGNVRSGSADAGAYRFDPGGNPGWMLAAGPKAQKALLPVPSPPDNLASE